MAVRYLNATGTQALINEIKSRLSGKASIASLESLQQRLEAVVASIPTKTSELENDSDFLSTDSANAAYYSKTAGEDLSSIVQQNSNAIITLNANSETEGSVDYKIAQAISELSTTSISIAEIDALF